MTHVVSTKRGMVTLSLALAFVLSACGGGVSPIRSVVGAPPIVWDPAPPGQGYASGPAGALALRWMDFTPPQFRIYFVFKPSVQALVQPHPVTLSITASSSLPASPATPAIPLMATIQILGRIDVYTIGVMHVEHMNRAGQTVTVAITPSLPGAAAWRLSPIHQLIYEDHAQTAYGGLGAYQDGLPEAQWFGPVAAALVSYVKVIIPGQAVADRSYVFVRSDDPVKVQVISKAQYLALAGAENFTP